MSLTAGKLYTQNLKKHWVIYLAGTLTLLFTSMSEVLIPRFVQWTLDIISGKTAKVPDLFLRGTPRESIEAVVRFMVIGLVVGWLGRIGWRQLLAKRTHVAGRNLKVRMWSVLRYLPLSTFHRYPLGDLMNRATGDWNASRTIHGFTLVLSLDLVFFSALAVVSMFSLDVELTLYCLAIFPFLPRFILKLAKKEHDQHLVAQVRLGELSDEISQALSTIRLQRATCSDAIWQASLSKKAKEYAERRFEVIRTGWKIFPLGATPTLVAYGVLLYLGVRKIGLGELTIGQFVALQSYVLMLQGPLFDMGDCIAEWQRGIASLSRLAEIFNLEPLGARLRAKKAKPAADARGLALSVKSLSFYYEGDSRPVLSDVSFEVRAQEAVGIVGPIGSGKTTLLSLFAGLVEAPPGVAFVAGTDARELAGEWIAQNVAMVPQRAFLFAGSIRYNLVLDEAFSEAELWHALHLVCLEDDFRAFPEGLDAWVGEWGINLSGGQKQRLALARALLRPRPIFFLDDCLSAVDAVTEEVILARLKSRLKQSTVLWVAHRLSTLKLCDRIFVLDAGRLAPVDRAALREEARSKSPRVGEGVFAT